MYRNWSEINKISDPFLRMVLATCEDPDLLRGLQCGFPHCFSNKKLNTIQVPFSAICHHMDKDENSLWDDPLKHFGIPHFCWGEHHDDVPDIVPEEWRRILAELAGPGQSHDLRQDPQHPIILEWKEKRCLLVEAYDLDPGNRIILGLTIVPEGFINMHA